MPKQKKQMKHYILSGFFLILFTACQKENINIPNTGRRIVINGLITTDSVLNVRISKSAYITDLSTSVDDSLSSVDNAKVLVYQNSTCVDSLYYGFKNSSDDDLVSTYRYSNYWSRSVSPLQGNEYEIVVKAPDLPDATAITQVPNLVRIESVDTSRILLSSDTLGPSDVRMICKIGFTDPGNEKNYYLFNICQIPNNNSSSINIVFDFQDPVVEEKLSGVDKPVEGIAFTDKIINGQKCSLTVTIDGNTIGEPFWDDSPDTDHKKTIYF
ncbi:MAG: DUF4249 family protein, partial [Bacteroidetes bacterium]